LIDEAPRCRLFLRVVDDDPSQHLSGLWRHGTIRPCE
jgi:hypothetical protein